MYEIFEQLLQLKGITPYQLSKETGISQSTLSDWKRKRSTPKMDKLKIIADYFNVTLEYLLGKSNDKSRTTKELMESKLYSLESSEKNQLIIDVKMSLYDLNLVGIKKVKEYINDLSANSLYQKETSSPTLIVARANEKTSIQDRNDCLIDVNKDQE